MADHVVPDQNTWAGILNAMNSMDSRVQWLLFSAFIAWLIFWRGFAWYDNRQLRREADRKAAAEAKIRADEQRRAEDKDEAEAERSREMSENLSRLCTVLEHHTSEEEGNATRRNHQDIRLTEGLDQLCQEIRTMSSRLSLKMSPGDSLAAIEDGLTGRFAAKVAAIFDDSLRGNNYAERGPFIKQKVKTEIGEALEVAQKRLETGYHLSVDLEPFFPVRDGSGVSVRHVLCDVLWEAVEPLYRLSAPIDERIEEMRVIVTNKVADQVVEGVKKTHEQNRR